MSLKAGVWIDHRQAIVVLVTEVCNEVKKFHLEQADSEHTDSGSRPKQSHVPEDKLERKLENHLKKLFDEVLDCVAGAESILILGPGEAKGEFNKRLKSQKARVGTVEVETADKVTDAQLVSKIFRHFTKGSATAPASPQKTGRGTTVTAASKKTSGK